MANKKSSVNYEKNKNEKKNKNIEDEIVRLDLDGDEENKTLIKIIAFIVIIALIALIFAKACSKKPVDKKPVDDSGKSKIEDVIKNEDEEQTSYNNSYVISVSNVSNDNLENEEIISDISNTEIEEEKIIDEAPIVEGVNDGDILKEVHITAADAITDTENLIVTIDDEDYNLGDPYNKPGKHTLKVVDESGNETKVSFIIGTKVTNEDEFNEAMADSENEVIVFANDFEITEEALMINRSVKITTKDDVKLTMGFGIGQEDNVCSSESKKIEFIDVVLDRLNSYVEDGITFNYGIVIYDTCDVELTLTNTIINIKGNNAFGIMTSDHRASTNISLINSKINYISGDEESTNDVSSGIYLFDESKEDSTNNINIDGSEINDIKYPILLTEEIEDKTNVDIKDSNITEEDIYVISNEESNEEEYSELEEEEIIENLE